MRLLGLVWIIIFCSGSTAEQKCRERHDPLHEDFQEVICSADCLKHGTIAYLQDGRSLTCSICHNNSKVPRPTTEDKTAVPPASFNIGCHKTFNNKLQYDEPTLNITWDQEERFIRSGAVNGYFLVEGNLLYRVFIHIKDDHRINITDVPKKQYIRFRYDCFGVENDSLYPKQNMSFWLASLPMSQIDDNPRNGLCTDYTIPELNKCGAITSTTTRSRTETYPTKEQIPTSFNLKQQLEDDNSGLIILLVICVISIVFIVVFSLAKYLFRIHTDNHKKQGQVFLKNLMMIANNKDSSICKKAHTIACNMKSNFKIECSWKNCNEKSPVEWYQKNMNYADAVIFFHGAGEVKTFIDNINDTVNGREHEDMFKWAIRFFLRSLKNSMKPVIFLVENIEDITYFNTKMHHREKCIAFLLKDEYSEDDAFYKYLKTTSAVQSIIHDQNTIHDQPKKHATRHKEPTRRGKRRSQEHVVVEEEENLIQKGTHDTKYTVTNERVPHKIDHVKDKNNQTVQAEIHHSDKDKRVNKISDIEYYLKRGARPKARTTGV